MSLKNPELTIALDAGGTEIKAGLVRGEQIIETRRWPTEREKGPDHAMGQVVIAAKQMHSEFPDAKAIGLVVPGVVNAEAGICEYSENIGWKNVPFGKILSESTQLPVGFAHDVRAGGRAEYIYGASRGYKNSFFMPIGTGIAGAIIINGKLFDNPFAGEIGHLDVKSGLLCACGSSGCLETVSTGPSITSIYNSKSTVKLRDSKQILGAAQGGDAIAREVWNYAVEAIAFALTAYVDILAPDIIILGGGVSRAGDELLRPIEAHFKKRLTFLPLPKLVVATLGDHAGMIGAGIVASEALDPLAYSNL